MPLLHFVETCMTQDRTENSRAPPMRHHGFKMARRVSDAYKMCDCFTLSCSKNVLIYRNIHVSKIYPRILKLQQKFTLFWIFPRTIGVGCSPTSNYAIISNRFFGLLLIFFSHKQHCRQVGIFLKLKSVLYGFRTKYFTVITYLSAV